MLRKVRAAIQFRLTDGAHKVTLPPKMNLGHVGGHVLLPAEPCVAHLAPEGLDAAVGHDVQLELVKAMKLLAASQGVFERAFELFLNIVCE